MHHKHGPKGIFRPNIPKPSRESLDKDSRTEISQDDRGVSKLSYDDTTRFTCEEDINIDQFLMDDLAYIFIKKKHACRKRY